MSYPANNCFNPFEKSNKYWHIPYCDIDKVEIVSQFPYFRLLITVGVSVKILDTYGTHFEYVKRVGE